MQQFIFGGMIVLIIRIRPNNKDPPFNTDIDIWLNSVKNIFLNDFSFVVLYPILCRSCQHMHNLLTNFKIMKTSIWSANAHNASWIRPHGATQWNRNNKITHLRGGSRGSATIFGKVNLFFFTFYTMSEKIFLKSNFDFIVAEIRGVFLEVWGCARVCVRLCDPIGLHDKSVVFYLISVGFEIVAATVFCSVKAQFWMISDAILIPKIYARLHEIASNFSKIFWGRPQTPRRRSRLRGLCPLTGPPISKIPGSAPASLMSTCRLLRHVVRAVVSPWQTRQYGQLRLCSSWLLLQSTS